MNNLKIMNKLTEDYIRNLKSKAVNLLGRTILKLDQLTERTKQKIREQENKKIQERILYEQEKRAELREEYKKKPLTILEAMEDGLKEAAVEAYRTKFSAQTLENSYLELKKVFPTLEEKDGKFYLMGYVFHISPAYSGLWPLVNSFGPIRTLEQMGEYILLNEGEPKQEKAQEVDRFRKERAERAKNGEFPDLKEFTE